MKWVLRSQLKQLHRRFGYTMVYVTHDQTEALTFADTVVVMYEGEIVQIGTPERAVRAAQPHLRRLFHRLAGHERHAGQRSMARPRSSAPDHRPARAAPRSEPARKIELGVRPEYVRLGREGLPVPITQSRISAATRSCAATLEGRELAVIVPEHGEIPAEPRVRFDPKGINIYADSWRQELERLMDKTWNNKAWFLVLPVLLLVAFSAIIPLMTVVNYSVQDTFGNNDFFWAGHRLVRRPAAFAALLGGAGAQPRLLRRSSSPSRCRSASSSRSTCPSAAGACRSASC